MKRAKVFLVSLFFITALSIFLYSQNHWISMDQYVVQSSNLPQNFDDFKIVHLSDLHGQSFGKNQSYLLKKIHTFKPDLIAITGDLFDASSTIEASFNLIEQLTDYPVYFVTGNHESWRSDYVALEKQLAELGVHILHNEHKIIEIGKQQIEIIGIDDPNFGDSVDNNLQVSLKESDPNSFKLLLSHRPETFEHYVEKEIDLVLSGHAHGGQFRLPFINGLVAPDQDLFPTFTEGIHTKNKTTMIISRGLGNSIIPQRLFNRPNLIQIILKADA